MARWHYSRVASWTALQVALVAAMVFVAINTVKSQDYEDEEPGQSRIGFEHDYDNRPAMRESRWEPLGSCTTKTRELCCRLRAQTTRDGSIEVSRPRCPVAMVRKCCSSVRNTKLSVFVDCIQEIIMNLLEFKLHIGTGSVCCNLPFFKRTCNPPTGY